MNLLTFACLLAMAASPISGNLPVLPTYAQYVNKTTAFIKVIKTDDVEARDAIYTTPPVVMIGKRNGVILRCLQEDLNECEVFYKAGKFVRSLVVTGEYLYAGLDGNAILKCELNIKDSCKTLHTCDADVHALVVAGGYLYAGLYSGAILRCDLNLPNSCRKLFTLEDHLYSLNQFNEYIYAGLWNGQMIRYSTRADDSFTPIYKTTSAIMGFSNTGNSLSVVTWDGTLWNCSQTSNAATNFCESIRKTNYNNPSAVAQVSGMLYVLNIEGLHVCKRANDTSCLNYDHHKDSWSMAFVYGTYQMQSRYKNEHTACTWQSNSKCPPFVTYYDVQERDMLEVNVRDGKLYNAQGFVVDTSNADIGHYGPAAIFAMGPDGKILMSNSHKRELLHTSSLFAGSPVSGAGEMVVKDGVIVKMKACSEHYRLDANMNKQVVQSLLAQGYSHPIDSESCGEDLGLSETRRIYPFTSLEFSPVKTHTYSALNVPTGNFKVGLV